jgi:hypothetical protein
MTTAIINPPAAAAQEAKEFDNHTQQVIDALSLALVGRGVTLTCSTLSYLEEPIGTEICVMKGQTRLGSVSVMPDPGYRSITFYAANGSQIGSMHPDEIAHLETVKFFTAFVDDIRRSCVVPITGFDQGLTLVQ